MAQRGLKFGLRIFFLLSGSPSFTVAAKGLRHVTGAVCQPPQFFRLGSSPPSHCGIAPHEHPPKLPPLFDVVGSFQKALQWSDGLPQYLLVCKYNVTTLNQLFANISVFSPYHCCRKQLTQCCLPPDCALLGSAYVGPQSPHVSPPVEAAFTVKLHESASTPLVGSNLRICQSPPYGAMPQVVAPIHQAAHIV